MTMRLRELILGETVTEHTSQQIPLGAAVLCLDCETVSNSVHVCSQCGGAGLMNLATVLNRERGEDHVEIGGLARLARQLDRVLQ